MRALVVLLSLTTLGVLPLRAAFALSPATATATAAPAPTSGDLVLGEFDLGDGKPILDGDTIRVKGLDASLRLLGIDTEEIYHHPNDEKAAKADFVSYCKAKRVGPHPAKFGTPMGVEAWAWARRFFDGVKRVRLEYDDARRHHGYYGRYLVYVFAKKDGRWVNYNVEAVRAGMAPYFVKYGRSLRFDREFREAQAEARKAHRGIWDPTKEHYPDYAERLAWWNARADAIDRFHAKQKADPSLVEVGTDDTMERLKGLVGRTVTLFAVVGEPRHPDKKPYLVPLSNRMRDELYLVAFDDAELAKIDPKKWEGEYVYVRGKVSTYRGRPQIKAADLERIWPE